MYEASATAAAPLPVVPLPVVLPVESLLQGMYTRA